MPEEDSWGWPGVRRGEGGVMLVGRCRCVKCGYDLVGLAVESVCPECATRVDRSLTAAVRWTYDAERMKRLNAGFGVMMVAAGAGVAGTALAYSQAGMFMSLPMLGLALLTWMAGVWWATPAGTTEVEAPVDSARVMARAGTLGVVVGTTMALAGGGVVQCAVCVAIPLVLVGSVLCLGAPLAYASGVADELRARSASRWCTAAGTLGVLALFLSGCGGPRIVTFGMIAYCALTLIGLGLLRARIRDWLRWLETT